MATESRRALLAHLAEHATAPGKDCETAYANYLDPNRSDMPQRGHELAFVLADCLLANTAEAYKTDMASTSILFGLLPSILSQIVPSVTELSRLSLRRPVLAFMIGFGGMSLPVLSGRDDFLGKTVEPYPHMSLDLSDRENRSLRVAVVVSAAEYLIAAAAVFNVLYFTWTMTYVGVSFSVIQIYITNLPETAIPFMWMLLVPLVHLVAFFAIRYATKAQPEDKKGDWVKNELLPCMYGPTLDRKFKQAVVGPWKPWNLLLEHAIFLGSLIHLIAGTAILCTILFIEQWKAIQLVAQMLGGEEAITSL
ncbi:hypothetical protein CMUS01_11199 [Colletotrichum musicola]|uniref:Uncharacterized protein n=1 Tax=Colletotrichum musicola TaxID=2175873 RepID=A0A8H6N763_9PEZI|nr:hypothetical protein CMUS01_11199 [Colletotrichum musicola]